MPGVHLNTMPQTAAPIIAGWNGLYSATSIGVVSSGLAEAGQFLNSAGYQLAANGHPDLGTMAGFVGNLAGTGSAITNPVAGFLQMSANRAEVAQDHGGMAGLAYSEGSLFGLTQIGQAATGSNFVTGQSLSTVDCWSQGFGGVSAATGWAAMGTGALQTPAAENTTLEQLQRAASRAAQGIGEGNGLMYGTAVLSAFKAEVQAMGGNLRAEVSYFNGVEVKYGTPGSVRLDVAEYGADGYIKAVYDLKTGSSSLTEARISQIRSQLPGGGAGVPVQEVRP